MVLVQRTERARSEVTSLIASTPVLSYYKPNGSLEVQCGSSQAGLGVTIKQGGLPIAFETGALTNRVPLRMDRKGMLAIFFAMEKFNDYTFGRKRVVFSNHKPVKSIPKKPLHRAPKRLKRMVNSFTEVRPGGEV